jgi:hypothetical protein
MDVGFSGSGLQPATVADIPTYPASLILIWAKPDKIDRQNKIHAIFLGECPALGGK